MLRKSYVFSLILLSSVAAIRSNGLHVCPTYSVQSPESLGGIELVTDNDHFYVKNDTELTRVHSHDIDSTLKEALKKKALQRLLEHGYISVSQYDNGDYILRTHARINGSGPITAKILYGATLVTGQAAIVGGIIAAPFVATTALPATIVPVGATTLATIASAVATPAIAAAPAVAPAVVPAVAPAVYAAITVPVVAAHGAVIKAADAAYNLGMKL